MTSAQSPSQHNAHTDNQADNQALALHNNIAQILAELHAARNLDLTLITTLKTLIANTSVEAGAIGVIDSSFTTFEDIVTIVPGGSDPVLIEKLDLIKLKLLPEELSEPKILKLPELSKLLEFDPVYRWHYLELSSIMIDQNVLICLSMDQADNLSPQELSFVEFFIKHAIIAIKNAFLNRELDQAIQAKNDYINFISHELKSPLTVIKGYADIMIKGMAGSVTEEQIDYLTTITHNVRRMSDLITELADQSQIETQSLRLVFETAAVDEVINEVLQSYKALIQKQSQTIKKQINKPIEDVWCDRQRLTQILSNLVSNAIKYSPDNSIIKIGAEQCPNKWDLKGPAEVIHFWVKDNGYGISEEDRQHIFEKFFRGTNPLKDKKPGTGLGLVISKSLTEMMGGRMWFECVESQGTTFHFTLPI
jgi:signal transduction histidine kinase